MMFLLLFLLFAATVAAIWLQGLWSAVVTLVNLLLAMMIATNFYEPITTQLESAAPALGTFTYLLDFVVVWLLFALSYGVLRAITDFLSPSQVKFELPIEMVGRSILAAFCGWLLVCFAALSLQMAPLNSESPLGAWKTPTAKTFLVTSPDRLWLGFMYSRSKGALAGGKTPDALAELPLKYHERRKRYADPSITPEMRVLRQP